MEVNMKEIKDYTDQDLEKLLQQVKEIPPITGNMVDDYSGLLMKEIAAVGSIWKEYCGNNKESIEKINPLIANHMQNITAMYDRLMSGVGKFTAELGEAKGEQPCY